MTHPARQRLPNRRYREAFDFEYPERGGHIYRCEIGRDWDGYQGSGEIREIFLSTSKSGAHLDAMARDSGLLISLALQHGTPLRTILASLTCDNHKRPVCAHGRAIEIILEREGG